MEEKKTAAMPTDSIWTLTDSIWIPGMLLDKYDEYKRVLISRRPRAISPRCAHALRSSEIIVDIVSNPIIIVSYKKKRPCEPLFS